LRVEGWRRRARDVAALLVLNSVLLGLLLGAGEAVLRARGVECRRVRPAAAHGGPAAWAESDAELGWTYRRTAPDANPQGFRDARPFDGVAGRTGNVRVMVLGDSFMWGAGVAPGETVPALLEQALPEGHHVFNVAVPGWGIDQMYLAYRHYRDVVHPHVIVLAFIDDDVNRVIEAYRPAENLEKPIFTLTDGEVTLQTPADLARLSRVERFVEKSVLLRCATRQVARVTTARSITARLFEALVAETRRRGERLVIVRIPTRGERALLGRLVWRLWDWGPVLTATGTTYVELSDEIGEELYAADGHLSPRGNHVVAQLLCRRVFGACAG
jgi:hypothetical protein